MCNEAIVTTRMYPSIHYFSKQLRLCMADAGALGLVIYPDHFLAFYHGVTRYDICSQLRVWHREISQESTSPDG
jgi:hypothetical protein